MDYTEDSRTLSKNNGIPERRADNSSDELGPADIQQRNLYKMTADKIVQTLSKVRNKESLTSKRWLWELLQNAKDIPNRFGAVRVVIELSGDKVKFSHNGDPFTLNNVISLIQQVSSKSSTNEDEEVTGKFGTGFISTHIISPKILVRGVVNYKGAYRQLSMELDREGNSSETLMPKIESALRFIDQIEDEMLFHVIPDYQELRHESSMDSSFTYELGNEKSKSFALTGITDLQNTMPQTLANVTFLGAIKAITPDGIIEYKKTKIQFEPHITGYEIESTDAETKKFLVFGGEDISLIAEVVSWEPLSLEENFAKGPNLYRDFPLIGSNKFHFPFIISSSFFNPTEDRDCLVLNSAEDDSLKNRELIESAISLAIEFSKWLIDKQAQNLYTCFHSRIPEPKEDWTEESKLWFTNLQVKWRNTLRGMPLIETSSGLRLTVEESIFPEYGDSEDARLKFYDIALALYGEHKIPSKKLLLGCLQALGPKSKEARQTWGEQLSLGIDELLRYISSFENEASILTKHFSQDRVAFSMWISEVLGFVETHGESSLLDVYAIIPSQSGQFLRLKNVYAEEHGELLSDDLIDILAIFGSNWRLDLKCRDISLPFTTKVRTRIDLSQAINGFLKDQSGGRLSSYTFLRRENAKTILQNLLILRTIESSNDSFRSNMYDLAAELYNWPTVRKISTGLSNFDFEHACHRLIEQLNSDIESYSNLAEVPIDLPFRWINRYLLLLDGSTLYKNHLDENNIIPNELEVFGTHSALLNFGDLAEPLDDLLLQVLDELAPHLELSNKLANRHLAIRLPKTYSTRDLADAIQSKVNDIRSNVTDRLSSHKQPLLRLIKWCKNNEDQERQYFPKFQAIRDSIFVQISLGDPQVSDNIVRLLSNGTDLEAIVGLIDSGVDLKDATARLKLMEGLNLQELEGLVKIRQEEKRNFEFLLRIGTSVEEALLSALESLDLPYQVHHTGVGSEDFQIENRGNGRIFRLELKSLSAGNLDQPISLSIAQSQQNVRSDQFKSYAVCVLVRPSEQIPIDADYIKENLMLTLGLAPKLKDAVDDYTKFSNLLSPDQDIQIVFEDHKQVKIRIAHNVWRPEAKAFRDLIEQIHSYLN